MKLSIIIVNYNVKYFLQQCLSSVLGAIDGINAEVFVVDNNSVDGSCDMVRDEFPTVKLIESKKNLGFSKGNNLAIEQSSGEYVLLLNPDTLVEEDTFKKVIDYMDQNPDVGGLGVEMIDGKGNFLPESKRGLPTPEVAFYKIFGLSALFPNSKKFGAYHLTYLNKNKTHEVDVLSGAFMLLRKEALDKVGLLDEDFFMYGEDIDLSYRIQKGGYKNIYFPETKIIHYKGESTKKSSVNYVFVFYNAMIIFAKKHFTGSNAATFETIINLAIYFRAALAILRRFVSQLILPLLDFIGIVGGLFLIKDGYHSVTEIPYDPNIIGFIFPFYGLIWILTNFLFGGYDKPIKLLNNLKGMFIGAAAVLIFYALLDESVRFSRAITLLGIVWSVFFSTGIRLVLHILTTEYKFAGTLKKRIGVLGSSSEVSRIKKLFEELSIEKEISIPIQPANSTEILETFQIKLDDLSRGKKLFNLNEIVFCQNDISNQDIIEFMNRLSTHKLNYKIAPKDKDHLIGSNSIETSGDIYKDLLLNSITSNENTRKKLVFDIFCSFTLLLTLPFWIFRNHPDSITFTNLIKVLFGKQSMIGYNESTMNSLLPKIKSGLLSPKDLKKEVNQTEHTLHEQNISYAKNYSPKKDFNILLSALKLNK